MQPTIVIIAAGAAIGGGVLYARWRRKQAEEAGGGGDACAAAAALAEKVGGPSAGAAARAVCESGALDLLTKAGDALFTNSGEQAEENAAKNGARTPIPPALGKLLVTPELVHPYYYWRSPVNPAATLRYSNGCVPYGAKSKCAPGTVTEARYYSNGQQTTKWVNAMQGAMSGRPCSAVLGVPVANDGTDPFTRRHPTKQEWEAEVNRVATYYGDQGKKLRGWAFVPFPMRLTTQQEGWWIQGVPQVAPKGSTVAIDHRTGAVVLRPPSAAPDDRRCEGSYWLGLGCRVNDNEPYTVDDDGSRDHR